MNVNVLHRGAATKGLSIRWQIMLGFMLLIALSTAVTALNIYQLRNFHALFNQYEVVSSDTSRMLEIDANIAELQRLILAFSNTARGGDTSHILSLHDDISHQLAVLLDHQQPMLPHALSLLKKLETQIANFKEKIGGLQAQRGTRETIINDKLAPALNSIDEHLHNIYDSVLGSKNEHAIKILWHLQHKLAVIQTSSARYFDTHEFRDKQIIQTTFNELASVLKDLQSLNITLQQKKMSDGLIEFTNQAERLFHAAVQADRNYLFLINIVIAGESAEIANVSDELKGQFIRLQKKVYLQAEAQSLENEEVAIFGSILGSVLALLVAFLIGKKLSEPLILITRTFGRLALGESVSTIPATERTDEIGRLANAANVFRETNQRTQDLLIQTENFATELRHRELAFEQAAARAEEASLYKSQFLANMSHELRTPMNAILGMLALLQKTPLNERQQDYAVKSTAAARTLLGLLNDILDLSKAEAGKIELDPVPFNLEQLAADLNVILAPLASAKKIDLHVNIAPELPRNRLGDALRIQQILINLGGNAVKFTQTGGVTVAIEPESHDDSDNRIKFTVRDTGIGIADENISRIFTGFTQAEASITRRFGGTGLGLAISQRLVELMGGQLQVESELDKGSVFHFSLCLPSLSPHEAAELQRSQPFNQADDGQGALLGLTILLVEDNITNQQIAQELLELEGAKIITANDGQEAVDILREHVKNNTLVDAVLMDLQMPVMDGITAAKAIRQQLRLEQLPIIAMTANAMVSDRKACLDAGMSDHVGKPFNIQHLVSVLCRYTTRSTEHLDQPHGTTSAQLGLNVKAAIQRMGGKTDIYLRLLPGFIDSLDVLPETLRTQLAIQDHGALAKSLHGLKGISATFGFEYLSFKAAELEKLFSGEVTAEQAGVYVDQMLQTIEQSLQASKLVPGEIAKLG